MATQAQLSAILTPRKRKPILPPQSQPKKRLAALKKMQDARWSRPGVGTDSQGEPY